ncbi:MAG: hypothetical protein WAM66_09420 [Acidobacteriaceae bacterium]
MSYPSANDNAVSRLASQSDAAGRLAQDSGGFAAVVAAFESKDANAFRWVLERLEMLPYCELICEWVRIKLCALRCAEICRPVPEKADLPNLQQFAHAVVKLSSNEKLLRRVVDAISCGDGTDYHAALNELKLGDFCQLICHWVCSIGYERVCEAVCRPQPIFLPDAVSELRAAGEALASFVKNEKAFDAIGKAAVALNCEILRSAINQAAFQSGCEIICRFICIWRHVWVCRELCELPPSILTGAYAIEEAQNFALAARQLANQPRVLGDLVAAVQTRDAKAYREIVTRFGLGPYCWQLCAWVGSVTCHEFCVCVCPSDYLHPWFTNVGDFSIFPGADIDTVTGLTLKPEDSHGGPNYAFFGCLSLGGLCPKFDPAHTSEQMAYRFLYQQAGAAVPTPITDGFVCDVFVGYRYTLWHANPNTLQPVWIRGTGTTSPTPPISTPSPTPPNHYIVPDANGWVSVDESALDDAFDGYLMGFSSPAAFPGGPPTPGVAAGTAVPTANQNNGVSAAIIFQATRVSTISAVNGGAAPDYTNQLDTIRINNWDEVNELNFAEFATGCCTPIDSTLTVEFTVDHEEMGAGAWSLGITSCALPPAGFDLTPPNPPAPLPPGDTVVFTAGGRGASGSIVVDTSTWCNCSYSVTLTTRPGLTTGLIDRSNDPNTVTFAICNHNCPSLAAGITASQTTVSVSSSAGFPAAPFDASLPSTGETMAVTSVSGTTWTVIRGQAGTAATAAAAGATVIEAP